MAKNKRIVKLSCPIKGHKNDWIELDTSTWTPADFVDMVDGLAFSESQTYLKEFTVDWHLTGDNGLVNFPGVTANAADWRNALDQLGPGGLELMRWLHQTPSEALMEAVNLSSKSAEDDDGDSDGEA